MSVAVDMACREAAESEAGGPTFCRIEVGRFAHRL